MQQFAYGTRVQVIGTAHAYASSLGRTGTITDFFNDTTYRVSFDDGRVGSGSDTAYAADLELFVEKVISPSVKAQIEAIESLLATLKHTIGL